MPQASTALSQTGCVVKLTVIFLFVFSFFVVFASTYCEDHFSLCGVPHHIQQNF